MEDFKDLRVWVKAYELTLNVYKPLMSIRRRMDSRKTKCMA